MKNQQKFLRLARSRLGVNTEGLAELAGVALPTMRGYLLPDHSKAHRTLPEPTKRLIDRLVAEAKAKK